MLHRNYGFNARRTLLLGAAFACAWAPSVHAQSQQSGQPAAGQNEGLQDIIVTAQKREESNSKVGLSIVAMSGDALDQRNIRSEEHTSELQSLMRISYAVLCLTKKRKHRPDTLHNARAHAQHDEPQRATHSSHLP